MQRWLYFSGGFFTACVAVVLARLRAGLFRKARPEEDREGQPSEEGGRCAYVVPAAQAEDRRCGAADHDHGNQYDDQDATSVRGRHRVKIVWMIPPSADKPGNCKGDRSAELHWAVRSLALLFPVVLASCGPSPSGVVYVYVECPACTCTISWPGGDTIVYVQKAMSFDRVFADTLDYQVRLGDPVKPGQVLPIGAPARLTIHQGMKQVYSERSPTKQGSDTSLIYSGRTWQRWAE